MANNRDDFTQQVKTLLWTRVNGICSNPECRIVTVGPNTKGNKTTSIGVAAHISAAAPNGPRYRKDISKIQRSDVSNGIWLCASCSTIIDKDPDRFSEALLKEWKEEAEKAAEQQIGKKMNLGDEYSTNAYLNYLVMCFDRDAFHVPMHFECCMNDFNKAIADTKQALNTGILQNRSGDVLSRNVKKNDILNPEVRELVDLLLKELTKIQRWMKTAETKKIYEQIESEDGEVMYYFSNREFPEKLNAAKKNIIELINKQLRKHNITELSTDF